MRIAGNIPHPFLKITIFIHDSKYAVKFEAGLNEITHKFRTDERINSVEDIKQIIDPVLISKVSALLSEMQKDKIAALNRWSGGNTDEEFDVIV